MTSHVSETVTVTAAAINGTAQSGGGSEIGASLLFFLFWVFMIVFFFALD